MKVRVEKEKVEVPKRDVVFHLADGNMEAGFRAFFARDDWHHALGCRRFTIDPDSERDIFRKGGQTDGGLWKHAHTNLTPFRALYDHAVIILDADFDPHPGAKVLCKDIAKGMTSAGWAPDSFCVVVIDPELEAWLWAPNQNVALAFGFDSIEELRTPLEQENLWEAGKPKPGDLKAARDRAAKLGGKKTGGPLFKGVFGGISSRALGKCVEPGFKTMRKALQTWFPKEATAP